MFPMGLDISALGPQLVILFGEVQEEVCHWGQALRVCNPHPFQVLSASCLWLRCDLSACPVVCLLPSFPAMTKTPIPWNQKPNQELPQETLDGDLLSLSQQLDLYLQLAFSEKVLNCLSNPLTTSQFLFDSPLFSPKLTMSQKAVYFSSVSTHFCSCPHAVKT